MVSETNETAENVLHFPEITPENFDVKNGIEFQKFIFRAQAKLPFYYRCKVVGEVAAASIIFILALPLMLLVALTIRIRMGSPVIFKQLRVGKNGKPFFVYKFRTMHNNVPHVVELGLEAREKLIDDDRVEGRLGKFLRKWKWDELPQLWNVIKGDMVLIGPRPHPYHENFGFTRKQSVRFAVRPGISGLWQASLETINNPELKALLDIYYVRKMSLKMDLGIWLRTFYILVIGERFQNKEDVDYKKDLAA